MTGAAPGASAGRRPVPPLMPLRAFAARALSFTGFALLVMALCVGAGTWGYHAIAGLDWVDSLFNAAMILSGMGPASEMPDDAAKLFASAYALFAAPVWAGLLGLIAYPFVQRMLHALHLQMRGEP